MATTLLTTYGNNRILDAIAHGTTVAITAIAYGDGNGAQYEPSVDQTELKNQIGALTTMSKEFNPTDGFIYFKATIPANAGSFVLREFGLLDDVGGLISVTVVPDIEKPIASDGISIALPISIGFKTSTGEVMVVVENGTDVYANIDLSNLTNTGEHHFDETYATIDLDNLSLTGERHFLGRTHITNCITEIPQRIQYTLEDGELTIKAGSVIIVPYGIVDLSSTYTVNATFLNENFKVAATQYANNKFYVWATVQSDISTTFTTGAYNLSVFVDIANNALMSYDRSTDLSGSSLPEGTTASFYSTSANTINRYSAGTLTVEYMSFPIVRMTSAYKLDSEETQIATIDEVFNGISHMGSIIILDKDVRLLIPNGRNTNGSLDDTAFITSEITLNAINLETGGTYELFYDYTNSNITCISADKFFLASPNDALDSDRVYYDFSTNTFTQYVNSEKSNYLYCLFGELYRSTNSAFIASFKSKSAFRALDYNDFNLLSSSFRKIGDPIFTLSNDLEDDEVWLEGSVVSRKLYSKLYDKYGTTYGAGDGVTTFQLPDFRNRTIWGSTTFGYIAAGLPNIIGYFTIEDNKQKCGWAFTMGTAVSGGVGADGSLDKYMYFDANNGATAWNAASAGIYGNSTTVQPPSVKVRVKTRYK